jgi:uncharacterized protein YjbI with pentapeptide repeats
VSEEGGGIEFEPERPRGRWWLSFFSGANVGLPLLVFVLGVMAGIPIALFGIDFLVANAALAFSVLVGVLLLLTVGGVAIIAFRRPIWQRLFKVGEVELSRMAEPIGDVVRLTSEKRIPEATVAAGQLARFVMARYAWIATRRWIVGSVTGFVAVIAALAGSALLFQQNELLRVQGELMRQQTERLTEQTKMLETQIQLGEAQRSSSIVPEILAIGAAIGEASAKMPLIAQQAGTTVLDPALRARVVAATLAVRPYRYLVYGLDSLGDSEVLAQAVARRSDLPVTQREYREVISAMDQTWGLGAADPRAEAGELTDRIVSPERGHLLGTLHNSGLRDLTRLTYEGADFSFAEVRARNLDGVVLNFGLLDFADFSGVKLEGAHFQAAQLDHARFVRSTIVSSRFASIANSDVQPPFAPNTMLPYQPTRLVGTDFSLADIESSDFSGVQAVGTNFDGAAIFNSTFSGAFMLASTFRNAILYEVDFTGADLTKTDFDGAAVFDAEFLDKVAVSALAGTFDKNAYVLEVISDEVMVAHPNLNALARLPAEIQNNQPPMRLRRVQPIEGETSP